MPQFGRVSLGRFFGLRGKSRPFNKPTTRYGEQAADRLAARLVAAATGKVEVVRALAELPARPVAEVLAVEPGRSKKPAGGFSHGADGLNRIPCG
jgi:hypothetical protein